MAKGQLSYGQIVIGLVVLGVLLVATGIVPMNVSSQNINWGNFGNWGRPATVTVTQGGYTGGGTTAGGIPVADVASDCIVVDAFVSSTTYTPTSSGCAFTFYGKMPNGQFRQIGTGHAATLSLTRDYNGYLYIVTEPASSYLVDWKMTDEAQYRVEGVQYMDIDIDNVNEYVFTYNYRDLPIREGYKASLPITAYIFTYEAPTISTVDNTLSTVGTTAYEETIKFYTTQATTNRGWILTKIEVTIKGPGPTYTPSADTGRFQYVKIDIPDDNKGFIDISASQSIRDSDLLYTYKLGDDIYTGLPIKTSASDTNQKNFHTKIKFKFSTSDGNYAITLRIYYCVPASGGDYSITSATDSVVYSD